MKTKIPKKFQRIIWSYDISKVDLEKNKREIITQVLNYGTWQDLKLLFKIYPEKEIKKIIKNPRRGVWFKKVLNFWMQIYNLKLNKKILQKAIIKY